MMPRYALPGGAVNPDGCPQVFLAGGQGDADLPEQEPGKASMTKPDSAIESVSRMPSSLAAKQENDLSWVQWRGDRWRDKRVCVGFGIAPHTWQCAGRP
jgi:hypothetical protein